MAKITTLNITTFRQFIVLSAQQIDREILQDAGKVTAEIAKAHAESEFEKYRIIQDRVFESDFDCEVKKLSQNSPKNS